jgi:glycosyltransferase involved in cell wall biosynthesis
MTTETSFEFSVILPVHNRADLLRVCMECLAAQSGGLEGVEVWVLADGSPDPEALRRAVVEPLAPTRASIQFHARPKSGPAVLRNWAIRQSRGELLLFLNDDVEFGPELLALHRQNHLRRPGHGVCGNTRWHPECVRTPFMHWIAHGDSFYYLIRDAGDIGWEYVHTLNFSVHRRWFDEEAEGFCEEFPDPAFEDTEWAYRAVRRGLKVAFAPEAVAYHRHEFTPDLYWKKSVMKGRSARVLLARHPELRERILGPVPGRWARLRERAASVWSAWHAGEEGPREWSRRADRLFQAAALKPPPG